jgi:hypothetical protein
VGLVLKLASNKLILIYVCLMTFSRFETSHVEETLLNQSNTEVRNMCYLCFSVNFRFVSLKFVSCLPFFIYANEIK